MATVDKAFRIKNGLVVEGSTATVNSHDVITKEIFDAKGDLIVGTGSNTGQRLAVGTNGYILTADSSTTSGLTWAAAPSVGSFETSIVFEGTTANDFETTLQVTDPTADRTITFQDASGTVAFTSDITVSASSTNTFSNKSIALGSNTITGTTSEFNSALTDANFVTTGDTGTVTSTMIANGTIVNDDINSSAAIAATKISGTAVTQADTGTVTNTMLAGSIANDKLSNSSITINGTSVSLGGTRTLGTDDISEGSTNKYFSNELAQDAVGNAVGNGLDYDDSSGAISVDPSEFALNAVGAPTGDVSMATYKITGLGTPTNATDAATKAYVDSAAQGIDWKASVRAATTANVTLASDLENGDTLDGVTLATGDRILVKNQSTGSQNGIYVVAASGAPTRSTDCDTAAELTSNFAVFVEEGTANADQGYVLTNDGAITVGTTALTFTQFTGLGQIIAGTGLDKTGNTLDIDSTVTTNDGTQTLTNKSISGSANTLTNIPNNALSNSAITINGTSVSLGGTRTLGSDDISEGSTNKYFTDERAQDAIGNALGSGLSYNDSSGAISNSGVLSITGTANQVSADVSTGAVTLSLPQSIATTSSPTFSGVSVGSVTLTDALMSTATSSVAATSATVVDSWSASTYSSAKYLVQMKKGTEVQTLEVLINVDGSNNVAITEYADVINAAASLGTTDADYSGGNVRLLVTPAAADTVVKVHKTLIEA